MSIEIHRLKLKNPIQILTKKYPEKYTINLFNNEIDL